MLVLKLPKIFFRQQLLFLQRSVPRIRHHVALEIEDFFEMFKAHVEKRSDPARHAFEEPDMRDRSRQLNVAHALASNFGLNHFDTAFVADDPAMLHPLVFSAIALPVLDRTEDLCAKETVLLGFERPIVDGLRFLHLAIRP
jgi:hypothetical protein